MPLKLIVTDFKMPAMSGFDFIRKLTIEIKEINKRNPRIKVLYPQFVLCSAYLSP